jgi:2-succinyl-5-enolpyruvyl-6-hydroxy-3-cyclohexene-1-carboxylate synthase
VGPSQLSKSDAKLLAHFSDQVRIPLLCEAASGLACQGRDSSFYTLQRLETILEKMTDGSLPAPDLILRFGEPVTGRALGRLLAKHPVAQLVFEEWGEAREPNLHPSIFLEGGFSLWLAALSQLPTQANREWADGLLAAEAQL